MRRTVIGSLLAGALLASQVLVSAPPALAASGATCFAQTTVTITPGISLTATKGTVKSSGGKLTCVGAIKGVAVGGNGTFTFSGYYGTGATKSLQKGDTCAQGSGTGSIAATVPKVGGGSIKVSGTLQFVRVGPAVLVQGKLGGANLGGVLGFDPKQGQTCATVKVTQATVAGQVAVGG